jgi:hypothetical protein
LLRESGRCLGKPVLMDSEDVYGHPVLGMMPRPIELSCWPSRWSYDRGCRLGS